MAGDAVGSVPKVLFAWSSGKDSAMALFELLQRGDVDVCGLLTTVTDTYDRVSMHGVRECLLDAQAAALRKANVEIAKDIAALKKDIPEPTPQSGATST